MPSTLEHRAYDHIYDPVWTTPSIHNQNNNPNHHHHHHQQQQQQQQQPVEISGKSRFKYFEKPLKAHLGPPIILAPPPRQLPPLLPLPPIRTIGVQTAYRDSETQTDPYSPEYIVVSADKDDDDISRNDDEDDNNPPEILSLQHLSHRHGTLPITERDIARVERMRERREGMKALPPITDEMTLKMHESFLEEQERKDFLLREGEIDEEMSGKLKIFERDLLERKEGGELDVERRIEGLRKVKINERNDELSTIRKKRMQVLRKLTKERDEANLNIPGGCDILKCRRRRQHDRSSSTSSSGMGEFSLKRGLYGFASSTSSSSSSSSSPHTDKRRLHSYDTSHLSNHDLDDFESSLSREHVNDATIQRPPKSTLGRSGKGDRKALTLAGDLHLIDTLIKSRKTEQQQQQQPQLLYDDDNKNCDDGEQQQQSRAPEMLPLSSASIDEDQRITLSTDTQMPLS